MNRNARTQKAPRFQILDRVTAESKLTEAFELVTGGKHNSYSPKSKSKSTMNKQGKVGAIHSDQPLLKR
jgi:hypothetical protein